jgi:hypothetical protein
MESIDVKTQIDISQPPIKMTRHNRYYTLHREERLAKYNSRPDIIAKREEREKKRQEKEREKAAKAAEREAARQARLALALTTTHPPKSPGVNSC